MIVVRGMVGDCFEEIKLIFAIYLKLPNQLSLSLHVVVIATFTDNPCFLYHPHDLQKVSVDYKHVLEKLQSGI